MKRLLCLLLSLTIAVCAVCALTLSASAADGTLTVSLQDGSSVTVRVGQEFIFTTYLYAGPAKIVNAQGRIEYDSSLVTPVKYGPVNRWGEIVVNEYSFPMITGGSIVSNSSNLDATYYNFSSTDGIVAFDEEDMIFCRFRFKAIAAGKMDLASVIEYMLNEDEVKVYYIGVPDDSVDVRLSTTLEPSLYVLGDADDDYAISVKDVTTIQRICAGDAVSYITDAADANEDGTVTLRDAVTLRRYLAGSLSDTAIGNSIFESEDY